MPVGAARLGRSYFIEARSTLPGKRHGEWSQL